MKNLKSRFFTGKRPKLVSQDKIKNLRDWMKAKRGRFAKVARKLDVTSADIRQAVSGDFGVSVEKYRLIKNAALEVQAEENDN